MFISIRELELHEIPFAQEFRPQAIDFGPDVVQQTQLTARGRAELVEERRQHGKPIEDIRVIGDCATRVELPCARCLEPVVRDISSHFDLIYRPLGADAGEDERSVRGTESDISYYQGEGLLLEDVLREQLLLAVPIKAVCSETCKGLCPRCGRNLNEGPCDCPTSTADLRWTAWSGLRDKLKS
jgi:uncharacterized protein